MVEELVTFLRSLESRPYLGDISEQVCVPKGSGTRDRRLPSCSVRARCLSPQSDAEVQLFPKLSEAETHS